MTFSRLLSGIVVENNANSWTGTYLYSDYAVKDGKVVKNSALKTLPLKSLLSVSLEGLLE